MEINNERSKADASNFYEIQFQALRYEILGIKERVIKVQLLGITGIPLIIGAGAKYDLSAVLLFSPLIVLAFAFMLVFEQGSLMRAGEYIKDNLEKPLCHKGLTGWENWLQQKPSRRKAEKFFAWSAHIVFVVYFVVGTWLAFTALTKIIGSMPAVVMISIYCGGFLLAIYLVVSNFRIGTGLPKQNIESNSGS